MLLFVVSRFFNVAFRISDFCSAVKLVLGVLILRSFVLAIDLEMA